MRAASPAARVDLVREHGEEYVAPKEPTILRVGPAKYLSVEGQGPPGKQEFQTKLGALYSVAYTLKFLEKERGLDFKVPMLEGVWTGITGSLDFSAKSQKMAWRLLVRVPRFVRAGDVREAVARLHAKGKGDGAKDVHLSTEREGLCVQALHVGPYSAERSTVEHMTTVARSNGYSLEGPHHEIYLSDPRRVPARRLKTILRQPIRRAG